MTNDIKREQFGDQEYQCPCGGTVRMYVQHAGNAAAVGMTVPVQVDGQQDQKFMTFEAACDNEHCQFIFAVVNFGGVPTPMLTALFALEEKVSKITRVPADALKDLPPREGDA